MRVVVGEVAQERLHFEQGAFDGGASGARARHVLAELVGVLVVGAVDERRALQDDLAHRAVRCTRRGQQVHRADHVDLVQRPTRRRGRVDDQVGVQDRVDLRCAHDPVEDRVRRVGPYEFGAFERHRRVLGVDADDDFDVVALFEHLRNPSTPVGAQARHQHAHISRTRRSCGCGACRRALLAPSCECVPTLP